VPATVAAMYSTVFANASQFKATDWLMKISGGIYADTVYKILSK